MKGRGDFQIRKLDFSTALSIASVVLALTAWLMVRPLQTLTMYDIFPIFGLLAFGLMWAQIVGSTLNRYYMVSHRPSSRLNTVLSGLVVFLIVLHPVTLWAALFRDGFGVPPASYIKAYGVSQAAVVALLFGSIALCIFIAYEFRRWFKQKKWWRYIVMIQYLALALIFFHAMILGKEAGHSWFMGIWVFYGITLAIAVIYTGYRRKKKRGDR